MDPMLTQQLFQHLNWQSQKLLQLEQGMQAILREMQELKKSATPAVDKIEYNFDQLKIEKLEGTLNIGIASGEGKSIEDLSVNGQPIDQASRSTNQEISQFIVIRKKINDYLDSEIPTELQNLSKQHSLTLNFEKHTVIIEDLRQQIDERIRHYISETTITEKVKKDILDGLRHYLAKIKESEREA